MKRITIEVPVHLNRTILELKKDERFGQCTYEEIVGQLLASGMLAEEQGRHASAP